ncbi:actin-like ATPase domain-containing protein [Cutaneotrichosporon oleaginosum]|uniref:Actin-like ATPase domain-containing protein n=1 Tax=Cutaneotrichosporon oleaginosum TaxID=879819 RepID=A0A0J0XL40_9TREE|nr:actin-like ATPase domain-containing protein [Cutaneotrichosporon oleaginosum]KLT41836.1 actin-like ATPase domain-containing protein [Cutaneotrichosporon oleaginosum]TXT14756.1 hypothetical protein COLE_00949 [Cutaneotrichosporon oleaginosum]
MSQTTHAAPRPPSPSKTPKRADPGPSRRLSSPAHAAARRQSLYGHDDRIVIDPGSRVWKVGFSGEPDARACFFAPDFADRTRASEVWDLDLSATAGARGIVAEARRLVQVRIQRRLRDTFHKHLLTDGKQRKVIVVENTFLPTYVKELITATLFDNLKCPSISFTPSSILALAASGRVTGLVVDVGWLETTITPVFCSRPLYTHARSSPVAGRTLFSRLRALLRRFGRYTAPPRGGTPSPATPPPLALLSDQLVERVLTEACFAEQTAPPPSSQTMDLEGSEPKLPIPDLEDDALLDILAARYASSQAEDWTLSIPSPRGTGACGRLVVPGWLRQRVVETLFGDGPDEEDSVPELILHTLERLPVDLRPDMISSILVTGGIAALPGFISRVRNQLLCCIPAEGIPLNFTDTLAEVASWRQRSKEPYAELYGLSKRLAIINDPAPLDGAASASGGTAPRWAPSLVAWVGGSLSGALKTSAPELVREDYDARVNESVARGEEYRAALERERDELGIAMAAVGLDIDELGPGMARGALAGKRKRGWVVGGIVPDWTTARVRAGV